VAGNRIQVEVDDLAQRVDNLKQDGARFRNEIAFANRVKQILVEDASGNRSSLFEPQLQDLSRSNPVESCARVRVLFDAYP
jgi:hypothetical protein